MSAASAARDAAVLAALQAGPSSSLPMHLAPALGLRIAQVSLSLQRLRKSGHVRFEAGNWIAIEEPRA
ncbi:hypothetical protein GOFOIKOB_0016 [Methylobacterium tardum]|uniref:Uncharacterized protein n=1 Tax=Methylobacterium tardum TaxID=374432 RepID=A0AA37TDC3_9HYPH|nr:hypothetical protein [Methylobacterium tardum]URD36602.1 hypothetical protein M6G65_30435 [Methylobacterium tardum]GJE46997.1 hypothetical protein GOFOIKOB_0016 [Methylobacterium tardum]GLS71631.1 hypothetical protein GCM10007890_36440 [Methylobacterium tardum]